MSDYRVLIRRSTTSFAPGPLIAELGQVKNLGYGKYLNEVGEAFFTLTQGDLKIEDFTDYLLEPLHLEIWHNGRNRLEWAGWLGETDETETDIVYYAYSYESALFWLLSEWNATWTASQINTIISGLWNNANVKTNSMTAWMTAGTLEAPVTTSGGATPIVMAEYTINYKRTLHAMQELVAMAASDTTNRVVFEVTPQGVFNLWKNKGVTRTNLEWRLGGDVAGYHRMRAPMDRRNVVRGVGSSPNDIVVLQDDADAADQATNGRREEPVYYSWIRDSDEISRVNKFRLQRALRDDNQTQLFMLPGRVNPADYELGDMVPVTIDHGGTLVLEPKLVTGQRIVYRRGVEYVSPIIQDSL